MNALPEGVASYFGAANLALSLTRVDAPDCELLQVNDKFCELTGYDRDEVIGRNCRFLQGDLVEQPGLNELRDFLADGNRRRTRTHLINYRADGTPFVNMLSLSRLVGPGGSPRFIMASQFDITAAAPVELLDYCADLRSVVRSMSRSAGPRDMFVGSLHSMAEAAASIAQARILLEEAENSSSFDRLFGT